MMDACDTITNDRVYRLAMTVAAAVQEIRSHADKQFDPQVAQLFLEIIDSYKNNLGEGCRP